MYIYFYYILFSRFESIEMHESKIPISMKSHDYAWPATCLFIFIPLTLFIHFELKKNYM